jgi:cell division protein FtsB
MIDFLDREADLVKDELQAIRDEARELHGYSRIG